MFIKALVAAMLVSFSFNSMASNIFIIKPGNDYKSYSKKELKRRIWSLERAVNQLQERVFKLEISSTRRPVARKPRRVLRRIVKKEYTCYISSFGETFTYTSKSKTKARAKVLQKCATESHAIHCKEKDIKCGE